MKFLIAITLYFIYSNFFFLLLVLTLGIPKIFLVQDLINKGSAYSQEIGFNYTEIIATTDKYITKLPDQTQQESIIILSFSIFMILTIINIIIFFRKSYLILPILTSSIIALSFFLSIWYFPSILPKEILFEINNIHNLEIKTKFLIISPFILTKILLIIFSYWYKIK